MKRFGVIILAGAVLGAATAMVPVIAAAQTTSNSEFLVEGGYRLPRSHQYEAFDPSTNGFTHVEVATVPGRIANGQAIYDRTATTWVSNVHGKNPMYDAATPAPTAATAGTPTGWQKVHGNVVSTNGSTMQFKADDGRTLTVDMSKVGANVQHALTANEGATLIGAAGAQANQFTAQYIQQDSSDPARGGKIVGQTPAPAATTTTPAPAATAGKPADNKAWQRIHGKVVTSSGTTLSLKTPDGQTLNVDTTKVDAGVRSNVKAGEDVTVIGFYRGADKKTVDAQFIQKDASQGAAASPRTTK
jgi:hypothetical protein